MYEYIKRTDAIKEINRGDLLVGNNAEWAREIIWRTPYADVVEVKHGRWVRKTGGEIRCSVCNALVAVVFDSDYSFIEDENHFCYNCGSKMDGESWYERISK